MGMFGYDNTPRDPFGWEATDLKGWVGIEATSGSDGNADEERNSQQQEAGCQPSTVDAASWGWAGGETA